MRDDTNKQQDFKAIGSMAGSIANDFNNWLSIISGYAQSISDNLIPKTRAHDDAIKILEAARHAQVLTKRLQSISKASLKNSTDELKLLNISHAIEEAIALSEDTFAEQNITVKYSESRQLLHILADYSQFMDCLMHLFFNAADAMQDGGTINIDTSVKELDGHDYCVIRIRDSGEGMTKDTVAKIFEPFFSTKEEKKSIGLGLTVVRNFVAQWGGEIRVRSRIGQGTSFRIFIPKADMGPAQKRTRVSTKGKTILAVDNSIEVLTVIKACLNSDGHKAYTVANGAEAIEYFEENSSKISIVILDFLIPDIECRELIEKLKEMNPLTPIIILSGFSRDYVKKQLGGG
ncbi:hypothetical protein BVX97_05155, partial [bacterium E08(2017)]